MDRAGTKLSLWIRKVSSNVSANLMRVAYNAFHGEIHLQLENELTNLPHYQNLKTTQPSITLSPPLPILFYF